MRILVSLLLWVVTACAQPITVVFPAARSDKPLDGRLLLLLSNDPSDEPRMQIDDTLKSQMIFGVTVDAWKPGDPLIMGDNAQGYPGASLQDVPAGEYTVQAVLNVYETFHRSDGKTVKLAPDRGEGQHWNLAPGNLLSKPRMVRIGPGAPPPPRFAIADPAWCAQWRPGREAAPTAPDRTPSRRTTRRAGGRIWGR